MIHIISPGYNCEKYVHKLYDSIISQSIKEWNLHLIDDGSTDFTSFEICKIKAKDNRVYTYQYEHNEGACKRRYDAIKPLPKDDIIVLLDMDDELIGDALSLIYEQHTIYNKWMTYSSWINQYGEGLPEDFELNFSDSVHKDSSYRKVKYRSTGVKSFYKFLFDEIPENDFKVNGKWFTVTTESELMFSLLEMCGKDRIGIIKENILLYRKYKGNERYRLRKSEIRHLIYNLICNRKPKKRYAR